LVLQQNRLHWYGHVLRKEDDDWVKKCMKLRSKTKRKEDQKGPGERFTRGLSSTQVNIEDAIDRCKWRKMIKDVQ